MPLTQDAGGWVDMAMGWVETGNGRTQWYADVACSDCRALTGGDCGKHGHAHVEARIHDLEERLRKLEATQRYRDLGAEYPRYD